MIKKGERKMNQIIIVPKVINTLKEIVVSDKLIFHIRRDYDDSLMTPEAELVEDLGFDSLGLVELMLVLEEKFSVTISDDDAEKIQTIGDIINYLDQQWGIPKDQLPVHM